MEATARARAPKTRNARPGGTGRASTNYDSNNNDASSTDLYRLQFLNDRCGVSRERGALISALIWGGRSHV